MLKPSGRQLASQNNDSPSASLQLLLFVDQRVNSQTNIQRVQKYLRELEADYTFDLQIIEVKQQPYLVEHFKLVATPALVKIYPEPQQTLAGSDLVAQLKKWWSRWQESLDRQRSELKKSQDSLPRANDIGYAAEFMRLSDEVFRLQQEKEELLELLKFKDQVLAMLAHDLRSPLTAASIALETMELTQNKPNHERSSQIKKQLLSQAKAQFRTMNRMITDILQAAQGKSSELKLELQKIYLQSLLQEVLEQFQSRLREGKQKLVTDFPQDTPPVYADPELMRQVIVNLLDNAAKYTPEGGEIQVSILHRTSQKIQVSFCDNGPGIPEEKRDRIFEDHFRLKRDQVKDGYGLGLALCQKVIRRHYGHIWVDSVPNHGSCFHFTLPVYRS